MNKADQLPFGGFALFGFGRSQLGNLADGQLHQFVFSLQPIVNLMSGLAATLEKNLTGSLADLFFGWAIKIHTNVPPV